MSTFNGLKNLFCVRGTLKPEKSGHIKTSWSSWQGKFWEALIWLNFHPSTSKFRCNVSRKLIYQRKKNNSPSSAVSLATVYLGFAFDRFTTGN
jgi:hypothetical protein